MWWQSHSHTMQKSHSSVNGSSGQMNNCTLHFPATKFSWAILDNPQWIAPEILWNKWAPLPLVKTGWVAPHTFMKIPCSELCCVRQGRSPLHNSWISQDFCFEFLPLRLFNLENIQTSYFWPSYVSVLRYFVKYFIKIIYHFFFWLQ